MARFGVVSLSSRVASFQTKSFLVGAKAFVLTFLFLPILLAAGWAQSDPSAGIIPFSTQAAGVFESVDLATGNIYTQIPVRNKIGKLPFSYALTGNSSAYVITGCTPVGSCGPPTRWGMGGGGGTLGMAATVVYTTTNSQVNCGGSIYSVYQYTNFYVTDSTGATHQMFPLLTLYAVPTYMPTNCGYSATSGTAAAWDGSGYTLIATSYTYEGLETEPIFTVYDRSGNAYPALNDPQDILPPNYTVVQDPDGATITDPPTYSNNNYLYTTYTDTLDTTALTYEAGSGALNYLDAAGNTQQFEADYSNNTQTQTNFGCPGIQEYTGGGIPNPYILTTPTGNITFTYEITPGDTHSPHYVTGRLASITYPSGASVSYTYAGGNNNTGIYCPAGNTAIVPTLTKTVTDVNGNRSTWTYVHSTTGTVTVTDPASNQIVYTFAGGEYQTQALYYQGSASGGTLLKTVVTCYDGNNTSRAACLASWPGRTGNPPTEKDVYTYLGSSTTPSLVVTMYNRYGSVTSVSNYDFGAAYPPSGTPIFSTTTSYNTGSSCGTLNAYIYDRPCTVTTYSSGTQVSQTSYTYNSTGHAITTSKWVNSSASPLNSSATYNTNGTVKTATDVNGALYTYGYGSGCNNVLPTSVTVTGTGLPSAGLVTSQTWNCNGAVVATSTDANSQVTNTYYALNGVGDPYYRPLQVVAPYSTTTPTTTTDFTYTPTQFESAMNFNGTTSTTDQLATTDGLGRQIFTQTRQGQGPSTTTFDTTQTAYGWASTGSGACTTQPPFTTGPCTTQSVPYSGTEAQSAPSGTALTTTQNDALGRPVTVTDGGGGTVSYQYIKNDVLQTVGPAPSGENTKRRQLEYDGLGRLTSVCEITSAVGSGAGACGQANPQTGLLTKYTYDSLGNLLTVTQNAQPGAIGGTQTRTYTYDGLNRLTAEANPETNNVAYTYKYDSDATCGTSKGDLVKSIDPNGNTICDTYDALHRTTSTTFSGPNATTNRYFVYDAATVDGTAMLYPKGRLVEGYTAPSLSGTKVTDEGFSYTPRGELTNFYESTPHSAGYYSVPMTYWANGLVETFGPFLTYASLGYNPDGEGRAYSLQNVDLLQSTTYNAASQPTQLKTPCTSGTTCYPISYQYDPNTLRMTQYSWALSGGTVSGTLNWNPNGSLQKLVVADPFNSADAQTCTYSADDLVRISSVSCNSGAVWGQQFTYDAFGNLTKTVPTGATGITWQPGYRPSTNRYTLGGTSYDANGNVLKDTFNIYTWDAEGKNLSTAYNNGGGETFSFTYDAFGHKVELAVNGTYSLSYVTLGNYKLSATGQTANYSLYPLPGGSYVSVGGGLTGVQMADWLGTIRAVASDSGADIQTGAHAPFGEEYSFTSAYPKPSIFTGQLDDGNDNPTMYYFQERNYPSSQGRWLSPDPSGLAAVDPTNPQSWNRYAYVLNNPLSNIDPDGLDCVYLNDAGDDVQSIDHDSNADECTGNGNGGYWVPGTVANSSWVTDIDQNNGTIGAYSNQNGFIGWTASANNDSGVAWQTVGVDVPNTNVVVNVTSSADDLTPEASAILSLTYLRSMHDLGCWFGVSSGVGQAGAAAYKLGQPVPGSKPFITPGSSLGTSPLSEALHGTMPVNAPIPTPVGGPGTGVPFRIANTSSIGTAAARYAPLAGLAAMGYSVYKLNQCLSSTPRGH